MTLHKQSPLIIIYLVAIAVLTLFNLTPSLDTFDTAYYQLAGEKWWHGEMDCLRTPVYPLLLKMCSLPWQGQGTLALMTILQSVVYLISIYFFYDLVTRLVRYPWIACCVTILYTLLPAAGWCNELLTESLSISLMVILSQQLVCFVQRPQWKRALSSCLLLLLMVFLRPNFIAFFAILPVLWIWQWIATKQNIYALALAFLLIPIGSYAGYCKAFQTHYGLFASSTATSMCDFYNLTRSGAWDISCLSDENEIALCTNLERTGDPSYTTAFRIIDSTQDATVLASACQKMKQAHHGAYLRYKAEVFIASLHSPLMPAVNTHTPLAAILFAIANLLSVHLSLLYVFILSLAFVLLWHVVKRRSVPILIVLLWCIVAAQCIGLPLKGSDSYARLLLPVYPMFLCLAAWSIDKCLQLYEKR